MTRLDLSSDVVGWSSESVVIPYNDRSTGKYRRYFPDFLVKLKNGKALLIEIKPKKETRPPKNKSKTPKAQQRYLTEVKLFAKNVSKWESAKRYAINRGWEFIVLTEEELGIRF